MKIKKLDMRGLSHDLMIVAFVVVFAIAGVAYLVASHADSCSPSLKPVSGAVSVPASSGCKQTTIGCTIKGLPAISTVSQLIKNKPSLVIVNYGPQKAHFSVDNYITDYPTGGTASAISKWSYSQSLSVKHKSTHVYLARDIVGSLGNIAPGEYVTFQAVINHSKNTTCSATTRIAFEKYPV